MLARIVFFTAVAAALLSIVLLALFAPRTGRTDPPSASNSTSPQVSLSLYLLPHTRPSTTRPGRPSQPSGPGAVVFRRTISDQIPEMGSRIVGKAQSFAASTLAWSSFDAVYVSIDTAELSGGLAIRTAGARFPSSDELKVVGGTGSFAFAQGTASFIRDDRMYRLKLKLVFPDHSHRT